MNDTNMTVTGNITADPEIRSTDRGSTIARLTVASTPRTFDKRAGEWNDGTTMFLSVIAFGHLAEHAQTSLRKGDRVIVTGQLRARVWENDDGTRGTAIALVAEDIGAALRYATADITRANAAAARERVSVS